MFARHRFASSLAAGENASIWNADVLLRLLQVSSAGALEYRIGDVRIVGVNTKPSKVAILSILGD